MPRICSVGDYFSHQHHGNDLGGFRKHLCGEADKFEGFVLAPAAQGVGNGGEGILVEGSSVPGLGDYSQIHTRYEECQDPVYEHQKLRVCEGVAIILSGHDPLLQKIIIIITISLKIVIIISKKSSSSSSSDFVACAIIV